MRLLHKSTLKFEEFVGDDAPVYCILSHTWDRDEITYADIVKYNETDAAQRAGIAQKLGWRKLAFMQNVLRDVPAVDYFWQDTCMIDKSSSAELSESINSMWRWYRNAHSCYVLMSDVTTDSLDGEGMEQFKSSRWFTRGWTLQELLAPEDVKFYNCRGMRIGTRRSLRNIISSITGIDAELLMGYGRLGDVSIARRMSWAADRQTTRVEDRAYCLLGIFDVNLALIYGEGEKAFARLQEEIMKQTYDQSIFAWSIDTDIPHNEPEERAMGVLARDPSDFRNSRNILRRTGELDSHANTNKGIKITLPIIRMPDNSLAAILCCTLAASHPQDFEPYSLAIVIVATAKGDGSFGRQAANLHQLRSIPDTLREHAEAHDIYLSKVGDPVMIMAKPGSRSDDLSTGPIALPTQLNQFRLHFFAPYSAHRNKWLLHRYITAPKPLGQLSTFHSIADRAELAHQLCTRGIHFPRHGPDRVLAIQYAHVLAAGTGFVIVLESKHQFRSWDLSVLRCGRDDNMEMVLLLHTGGRSAKADFFWMDNAPADKPSYRKRLDDTTWVNVQFDAYDGWSTLAVRLWHVARRGVVDELFELPA